jgi:heat shock protein HtpX
MSIIRSTFENHKRTALCPNCSMSLPVYEGYPTWCHRCYHNLNSVQKKENETIWDKTYHRLNKKFGESLFQHVLSSRPEELKGWTSTFLSYLLASCVHLVSLSILIIGCFLLWNSKLEIVPLLLGIICCVIAYVLRPRIPKLEKDERLLTEKDLPCLFQVLHRITNSLDSKPIYGVVLSGDYNASIGRIGLRRNTILSLGLPLFSNLSSQEKLALLGHEVGHLVNGDLTRGFYVGTALNTLATWYEVLHPDALSFAEGISVFEYISSHIMSLIAQIPKWLFYILLYLLFNDSQQSEYYADYISAKTAGTKSALSLLERVHYDHVYMFALQKSAITKTPFFQSFYDELKKLPEREKLRVRTVIQRETPKIDSTHPSTDQRMKYLEGFPNLQPLLSLTKAEEDKLGKELSQYEASIQDDLVEWFRYSLQ